MNNISKADVGDIVITKLDPPIFLYYRKVLEVKCDPNPASKPKYRISDATWIDEDQVLDCFTPHPEGTVVELNWRKLTIIGIDTSDAVYKTKEGVDIPLNEHWLWEPVNK